jgi:uncharacterized protein (TIGR00251 family)
VADTGPFRVAGGKLLLDIKAVPGASKTGISGVKDGRLRFRIAAAPEGGRANAELIAFLAKALGCAKKDLSLYSGEKSRLKTLALPEGLREKAEALAAGLSASISPPANPGRANSFPGQSRQK